MIKNFTYNNENYELHIQESDFKLFKLHTTYISVIILILLILFFIYDFFKDGMRTISSYYSLFSNKKDFSTNKALGFTKSNIIREIILFSLFIAFIFSVYFNKKTKINKNDINENLQSEINKYL